MSSDSSRTITLNFGLLPLGMVWTLLSPPPPAVGWIVLLLFFYKDGFGMKVGMALSKTNPKYDIF